MLKYCNFGNIEINIKGNREEIKYDLLFEIKKKRVIKKLCCIVRVVLIPLIEICFNNKLVFIFRSNLSNNYPKLHHVKKYIDFSDYAYLL